MQMYGEYVNKATLLKGEGEVAHSKMVAKATILMTMPDGTQKLKYHNTIVVTKSPDGIYTLNSGGYKTSTTKARIEDFTKIRISQVKGIWYAGNSSIVFYDGIQFKDGECISETHEVDMTEINRIKKDISKYVALITEENIPVPDSGDCWYCLLHTTEKISLGDEWSDNSHLISHMEEEYVVGSLIVNAMREAGYSDQQIGMHIHMKWIDRIRKSVRNYMTKRLLPELAR
jgi:hypothetical protein